MMTTYRIFLLSIAMVSWVFLCGLNRAVDNDRLVLDNQKTAGEPDYYETEHTRQLMEARQLQTKSTVTSAKTTPQTAKTSEVAEADIAGDYKAIKPDELEKPLDLSVPYKASENADLLMEQKSGTQSQVTNIFAPETRKKARSIEVDGDLLEVPVPEAEKIKTVDGAGIVIKLKR
jgi:hypothetical protein